MNRPQTGAVVRTVTPMTTHTYKTAVPTYTVENALDHIEANLHDQDTHAVAHLVAVGILSMEDEVSVRSESRARNILRAVKGVNF
jgi:hypothetical protein